MHICFQTNSIWIQCLLCFKVYNWSTIMEEIKNLRSSHTAPKKASPLFNTGVVLIFLEVPQLISLWYLYHKDCHCYLQCLSCCLFLIFYSCGFLCFSVSYVSFSVKRGKIIPHFTVKDLGFSERQRQQKDYSVDSKLSWNRTLNNDSFPPLRLS